MAASDFFLLETELTEGWGVEKWNQFRSLIDTSGPTPRGQFLGAEDLDGAGPRPLSWIGETLKTNITEETRRILTGDRSESSQ